MCETHTAACPALTLTEGKIKYASSNTSVMFVLVDIPLGFPFFTEASLSWEILDRVLLREKSSGMSVGRARKGSLRSIQRSTNPSTKGVNLAGKPFHV